MRTDQIQDKPASGSRQTSSGSGGNFNPKKFNPDEQGDSMNQDQTKGKFDQLKGKLKESWGRLTDDEIALYNGQRDRFFGKLEEKYGLAREEAEDRLKQIEQSCNYKDERAA